MKLTIIRNNNEDEKEFYKKSLINNIFELRGEKTWKKKE